MTALHQLGLKFEHCFITPLCNRTNPNYLPGVFQEWRNYFSSVPLPVAKSLHVRPVLTGYKQVSSYSSLINLDPKLYYTES